ncbi:MAG: hypothetical protein DMH00_04620, partial [Acidobacteria bacterium]
MKATIPTRTLHGALNALSENSGAREGYRLLLVAAVAGAITLYFVRGLFREMKDARRLVVLVALLSGFVWILGMRQFTAFHDFQSLFYVGFVLVFYLAILLRVP